MDTINPQSMKWPSPARSRSLPYKAAPIYGRAVLENSLSLPWVSIIVSGPVHDQSTTCPRSLYPRLSFFIRFSVLWKAWRFSQQVFCTPLGPRGSIAGNPANGLYSPITTCPGTPESQAFSDEGDSQFMQILTYHPNAFPVYKWTPLGPAFLLLPAGIIPRFAGVMCK